MVTIYQAFYKEEQKKHLDKEFTPYDNSANPVQNIYEHYIYHRVRELSIQNNIDKWGVFSWQWKNKLQNVSPSFILNYIDNNDGDVYLFNAFPYEETISYNFWEQGEWCHPGISTLGYELLKLMGENPNLIYQPMGADTFIAANYFVGNRYFWDGLLSFLDNFVNCLDKLESPHKEKLQSSAGYTPNPNLNYSGFICERMISTYLIKEQNNLKIHSAIKSPETPLTIKKNLAIATKNKQMLREWDNERLAKGDKIGTAWIENVF